jgi:DNA invertase Pin-like site-specific DNA recombinase
MHGLPRPSNHGSTSAVYADEAVTGTKDDRAGFQRLISDCRNGDVDMVITKSISRFARNTVTMLEVVRELKALGVDVLFEKENIHSIWSTIVKVQ